jgi:tryptophan synthase alpha chain
MEYRIMTDRFRARFAELAAKKEGAFVPFVNLCDPDDETSLEILNTLADAGADAFELGIPFSDPSADGPVIELSAQRALQNGATPKKCLAVLKRFRAAHPDMPVSVMLYINLVCAPGIETFFKEAAEAGTDAVLIPDLPASMRLAEPQWDRAAKNAGIALVAIVPPNADDNATRTIAHLTGGYTYLLSRVGITGTDRASGTPVHRILEILEEEKAPAPLLGFGVSKPEHVRAGLAAGAKGVIVGSAIVKIIENGLGDKKKMLQNLAAYVKEMKAATKG